MKHVLLVLGIICTGRILRRPTVEPAVKMDRPGVHNNPVEIMPEKGGEIARQTAPMGCFF
ncbi:MAG: hypothetical protein JEZ12_26385 [Desulfobacterium sp.]|nr:hypothetical protein [Desulfobacterium sp.]